jgi:hypothetical protein
MRPDQTLQSENVILEKTYHNYLAIIIAASVIIRGFLAFFLELGNDEVYYWTYALYPDLSHFDHPPMIGLFIQLTTLNLHWDHEFFLRLSSVVLGGVNTWLVFQIGKQIKNNLAGLIAAMLYNTSIYCFVIAGIFILPDTPQLFFWLGSMLILIKILPDREITQRSRRLMLLAGIVIGLAMISKYTSVFLWIAAAWFIVFYNRKWLKKVELYLAALLSLVIFAPVIWWNIQHDFISFTFHGERVSFFASGLRPDFFFTELFGQILYNNPVNFVIITLALIALWKGRIILSKDYRVFLLASSLPLIGLFLFFSLFRQTLPHWSGPGYLGLIVIAGVFLSERTKKTTAHFPFPKAVIAAAVLLIIGLNVALVEIKWGWLGTSHADDPKRLGRHDVTLDMSCWRDFEKKFTQLRAEDVASGQMSSDAPILSTRWFPAAHLDYYVAHPNDQHLIVIGVLKNIHKYAWINRNRPPLKIGSDAYYITNSRDYRDPSPSVTQYFRQVDEPEVIPIYKGSRHVQNFFVYRLKNLHTIPSDVLEEAGL